MARSQTLTNRFLIEFIVPAASPPSSLSTPVSTPGHDHIQYTTTPSPDVISGKDVFHALKQSVLSSFGDVGWGKVCASLAGERFLFPSSFSILILFLFCVFFVCRGTQVKYFSPVTNVCNSA